MNLVYNNKKKIIFALNIRTIRDIYFLNALLNVIQNNHIYFEKLSRRKKWPIVYLLRTYLQYGNKVRFRFFQLFSKVYGKTTQNKKNAVKYILEFV